MKVLFYQAPEPRQTLCLEVEVPLGTALIDAFPKEWASDLQLASGQMPLSFAIWGRVVASNHTLQEGDRVELLRDLRVDPKTARRERFAQQGSKKAGLFAKRR